MSYIHNNAQINNNHRMLISNNKKKIIPLGNFSKQ